MGVASVGAVGQQPLPPRRPGARARPATPPRNRAARGRRGPRAGSASRRGRRGRAGARSGAPPGRASATRAGTRRVEQVVRARLAGDPAAGRRDRREVAAVPARPAEALEVEVVDFLVARRRHPGMRTELREERRRARALGADHEEVGQAAGARCGKAGPAAQAHGDVSHARDRTGGTGAEPRLIDYVPARWIWDWEGRLRSSGGRRRGWASRSPRRSPPRAAPSRCAPATRRASRNPQAASRERWRSPATCATPRCSSAS